MKEDISLKEAEALVTLLEVGSREYENGKHCSTEELKDKLKEKFLMKEEKK